MPLVCLALQRDSRSRSKTLLQGVLQERRAESGGVGFGYTSPLAQPQYFCTVANPKEFARLEELLVGVLCQSGGQDVSRSTIVLPAHTMSDEYCSLSSPETQFVAISIKNSAERGSVGKTSQFALGVWRL